ncbi:XRE family transcriptional regulator [Streptomyces wuyuanensis]|uniref:XRE family transcriptional regulator n=1 Tax=Streptomyces wuyuanensis TaxID=1196353 RepID=UPI00342695C6
MTAVALAQGIRAAAARQGLRSGCDKQRIRKWEQLGVTPDAETQLYIAEVLGIPADAVIPGDWPTWLPAARCALVPLGPSSTVPALREALRTTMERSRRTVINAISGAALISLAGSWAASDSWTGAGRRASTARSVGDELVTLLQETTARLTSVATEQRQHTAPIVDAHLATVTDLLEHGRYTTKVGLRLHALAAQLSQSVAWHRFDLGAHAEAGTYWVAGLHSAHAGGDRDMGAALLGDLAYQASWLRDPQTASGILQRALTRTEHPVAQSLLQLRLARAWAAQGERRASLKALTAAEHHLGTSSGEPCPNWCAWMSEADLAVDSGQCLLDLGDSSRAHKLIQEGKTLLPRSRDKTRGVFLAYEAKSHLERREPELAAATARESLQLAHRTGAPRCVELVHDLLPRFDGYPTAQGVPELMALAAAWASFSCP